MSLRPALSTQLLAFVVAASAVAQAPVTQAGAPMPPRSAVAARKDSVPKFYHSLPYGSEAQFNPLTEILNEGFDMLRQENRDRRLGFLPYKQATKNVWGSLIHADSAIRNYGLWNALRNEFLPISLHPKKGQWVPNYTVHLIGSGMVSARMTEWYEAHDVPYPFAASFLTMYAAHFINEAVEDGGRLNRPPNVDPISDLYVFDLAGILLYRTERMRRLANNKYVDLTSWGGQPTINAPEGTLENTTQEFVIRTALPKTDQWRGFIGFGVSTVFGLSYGKRGGTAISFGAGADAVNSPIIDTLTDKRTVMLKPYGGIFVDRQNSLLFSAMVRDSKEVIAAANLYPGVISIRGYTTGLWAQLLRDGRWRFGVVPTWGVGVGQNIRRR
jgi:hypothetical protein